jgi:hypothetical protein
MGADRGKHRRDDEPHGGPALGDAHVRALVTAIRAVIVPRTAQGTFLIQPRVVRLTPWIR